MLDAKKDVRFQVVGEFGCSQKPAEPAVPYITRVLVVRNSTPKGLVGSSPYCLSRTSRPYLSPWHRWLQFPAPHPARKENDCCTPTMWPLQITCVRFK